MEEEVRGEEVREEDILDREDREAQAEVVDEDAYHLDWEEEVEEGDVVVVEEGKEVFLQVHQTRTNPYPYLRQGIPRLRGNHVYLFLFLCLFLLDDRGDDHDRGGGDEEEAWGVFHRGEEGEVEDREEGW